MTFRFTSSGSAPTLTPPGINILPDPTFYPSPKLAAKAPPETIAFVAVINAAQDGRPDALAVIDVNPDSSRYGQITDMLELSYAGDGVAPAIRYLIESVAQGDWAILVFHDVPPHWRADGDASVATHNKILEHIAELDVWCAPMGQVFDYVQGHWGRPA